MLIVYGTAIAKENGEVFFFEDIYGYDKAMESCFSRPTRQKIEARRDLFSTSGSYSAFVWEEEQPYHLRTRPVST